MCGELAQKQRDNDKLTLCQDESQRQIQFAAEKIVEHAGLGNHALFNVKELKFLQLATERRESRLLLTTNVVHYNN